jgi:hypothetical protein
MARAGAPLRGLVFDGAGAIVFRERPEAVTVLQIAAGDARAARDLLLAAAGGRALRLSNAPAGEPASQALARLGAGVAGRQYEMRLALGQPKRPDSSPTTAATIEPPNSSRPQRISGCTRSWRPP